MNIFKIALVTLVFSIFAVPVAQGQLAPPNMADSENAVQKIVFIESGQTVYNYRWSATRFEKDGENLIKITGKGDNDKSGKQRIEWEEESVVVLSPQGLRTLSWWKKSSGDEQMTWNMKYDWAAKKVAYSFEDAVASKKSSKEIPLESNALAGDSMFWALRGFPFEKGPGITFNGRIIDANGTTLGGKIIHRGEETITTAFGPLACYKLELKPTGVIGLVAPKMWIWYTKADPHIWVRFDGRDDGLTKPRTKNVLVDYSPKSAIK